MGGSQTSKTTKLTGYLTGVGLELLTSFVIATNTIVLGISTDDARLALSRCFERRCQRVVPCQCWGVQGPRQRSRALRTAIVKFVARGLAPTSPRAWP